MRTPVKTECQNREDKDVGSQQSLVELGTNSDFHTYQVYRLSLDVIGLRNNQPQNLSVRRTVSVLVYCSCLQGELGVNWAAVLILPGFSHTWDLWAMADLDWPQPGQIRSQLSFLAGSCGMSSWPWQRHKRAHLISSSYFYLNGSHSLAKAIHVAEAKVQGWSVSSWTQ